MKRTHSDASVAVLFRLDRLQSELESTGQQVIEVGNIISKRGGQVEPTSVLEGLNALKSNLENIAAQTEGISLDHIESGRGEAASMSRQIYSNINNLMQRIEEIKNDLSPQGSSSEPVGISQQGAVDGAYTDPLPLLSELSTERLRNRIVELTPPNSQGDGGGGGDEGAGADLDRMDTSGGSTGISRGYSAESMNGTSSTTSNEQNGGMPSETAVYSWGRSDLGALFLEEEEGAQRVTRAKRSKYSKKNFANVCTTLYHTVAVTTTGEVYGAGVNDDGQVAPDRIDDKQIALPVLIEALLSQRIIQVSCGENHTACLTASGAVVSFGCNEVGQLGHSNGSITRVGPRTMTGLGGKIIKQVSCGYLFTLVLSSDGEVFSCGVGECGGHSDGANRFQAERVSLLRFVPVAYLATGYSHSVAVTVTGHVWSWGANSNGQCGIENRPTVQESAQIPSLNSIRTAACGAYHSTFLSVDGTVLTCGKNHRGQLGLSLEEGVIQRAPVPVPQLTGIGVSMLACGDAHTVVLTREGRVLAMGANASGQLGNGGGGGGGEGAKDVSQWTATEVEGLGNARIFMIAAGGEQSFALSLPTPREGEFGAPPPMDEGTLDLIRKFSVIKPVTSFFTTASLLAMIDTVSKGMTEGQGGGRDSTSGSIEALTRTLFDLFSSASLVNGSFLSEETASGLDVMGLEEIYVKIMKLGDAHVLLAKLMQAFNVGIASLLNNVKELTDPDSLRCVLAYWQCPLNSNTTASKEPFQKLCDVIVRLPAESRQKLMSWTIMDYPQHIFATRLIKPLHRHLAYHLTVNFGKGRAVPTIAVIMSNLFAVNEEGPKGPLIPLDQFANDAVSGLPDESLLHDLRNWKARRGENQFTFCSFPFLLSAEAKRRLLNSEASLEQQQAAQRDMMRQILHGAPVMPYLFLQVDRAHLLQTTLVQIGQLDGTMLKKQLKVQFVGEEGVDEGGVKKEFFQLLIHQLFDFSYGMFKLTESKREIWFNCSCTWSSDEYQLVGVLVGLAIYNATLLDLHFPLVIYRKLLGLPVGLNELGEIEPDLMSGLQKLLVYDENATQTKVEDVFGLDFEVMWTEFDEMRRHELKPGGKEIDVTGGNRQEYVDLYVKWILTDSIATQFEAFKAGFNRVMGGTSISLLRAEELELLVCGTPHLNFHELEATAHYEGGYSAKHPIIRAFWETVHELPCEAQRKLLMFVTGSYKAPIGGLGKLSLLIQRAGPDSNHLPTSHTCFNALLLPEYRDKGKLRERLMTAINECQGFGLQ